MHGDLMAAHAELRLAQLFHLEGAIVDVLAALLLIGAHLVKRLVGEDLLQTGCIRRAAHGSKDVVGNDSPLAVDAAVFLVDAVAGDAGHAFARERGAIPQRQLAFLADGGAHA